MCMYYVNVRYEVWVAVSMCVCPPRYTKKPEGEEVPQADDESKIRDLSLSLRWSFLGGFV